MNMTGSLSDLAAWTPSGQCSIARALRVVGTRSAMLIVREAFYGTTRFDNFSRRVGMTDASTAARLKELVSVGVLAKQPYRPDKGRARQEYVLTQMGEDLLPVVIALMQWGDKYLHQGTGPLTVVDPTGSEVRVSITDPDGTVVPMSDLSVRSEPHLRDSAPAEPPVVPVAPL